MMAMYYVKDSDVADDIVQEFFISYWEKHQSKPIKTSFEAYACKAIRNNSISKIRSQQTEDKRINKFGTETYQELEEESTSVDTELLKLEVLRLIELLPPERKKILLLSAKEELSYKEIAAQLGISINTVKSQMVKAYAFIREHAQVNNNDNSEPDKVDILLGSAFLFALLSVG